MKDMPDARVLEVVSETKQTVLDRDPLHIVACGGASGAAALSGLLQHLRLHMLFLGMFIDLLLQFVQENWPVGMEDLQRPCHAPQ